MLFTNNNCFLKLLIGFRIGINSLLIPIFNNSCLLIVTLNGFHIQIECSIKYIYVLLFFLKKHSLMLFNILSDIICYEFINTKFRFILNYTILNLVSNLRLILKVKTNEYDIKIISVSSIYYTANWIEREIFDFFGLFFLYNKDLRRILLDYGFQGYPLRKDFPLSGFIEVYYDDKIKKITYDKINLAQEYRIFFFAKKKN